MAQITLNVAANPKNIAQATFIPKVVLGRVKGVLVKLSKSGGGEEFWFVQNRDAYTTIEPATVDESTFIPYANQILSSFGLSIQ